MNADAGAIRYAGIRNEKVIFTLYGGGCTNFQNAFTNLYKLYNKCWYRF
jgi:DNA relaxase NicK